MHMLLSTHKLAYLLLHACIHILDQFTNTCIHTHTQTWTHVHACMRACMHFSMWIGIDIRSFFAWTRKAIALALCRGHLHRGESLSTPWNLAKNSLCPMLWADTQLQFHTHNYAHSHCAERFYAESHCVTLGSEFWTQDAPEMHQTNPKETQIRVARGLWVFSCEATRSDFAVVSATHCRLDAMETK